MTQTPLIPDADLGSIVITTGEVAEVFGVTERAVQLWESDKRWIESRGRDRWHLVSVVRGVYEGLIAAVNKKKGPEGKAYEDLELREQTAKTEKLEIEVQRMKGELVPAAEVERTAFELARATSEAFMNLPARLADELAAEKDAFTVRTRLEDEIRGILENLTDEAENDIKKHFRYVSFNSERNPEVNSKGENHA